MATSHIPVHCCVQLHSLCKHFRAQKQFDCKSVREVISLEELWPGMKYYKYHSAPSAYHFFDRLSFVCPVASSDLFAAWGIFLCETESRSLPSLLLACSLRRGVHIGLPDWRVQTLLATLSHCQVLLVVWCRIILLSTIIDERGLARLVIKLIPVCHTREIPSKVGAKSPKLQFSIG